MKRFSLRILNVAREDQGYALLRPPADVPMLLAFIERLHQLGWLPPMDQRTIDLCTAFGARPHLADTEPFYEFCISGMRYERSPWLTVFFHVEVTTGVVRICGVEKTAWAARNHEILIKNMRTRVRDLVRWLNRRGRPI